MPLNYKFRLYPTREQELVLEQTLDGCRRVYNYFLSIPKMSEYDMNYAFTELKEQHPWLQNYHSKMLQMVAKQVAAARKAMASLDNKGRKTGRLSYRNNDDFNAFTYNQTGFRIEEEREEEEKEKGNEGKNEGKEGKRKKNKQCTLFLAKVGRIQIVLHRMPVNVKQITICRKSGKWYAIAACQILKRMYCTIRYEKPVVGIDVGITKFAHDSDNCYVQNLQFLTSMLKPVKRAHRRLSRRQQGSNNRKKARHILARLYERINNKRRNFLHKTSAYYCSRYDLIFLERLRVANLTKNHRLARRILDASWYTFKMMCHYKANRLEEVEPTYSSIDCSRCGHRVPKSLEVRTHSCPNCGALLDRDYNSAVNHKQNGLKELSLRLVPVERREFTPVEIPKESEKQERCMAATYRLQEEETAGKPVREASALQGLVVH